MQTGHLHITKSIFYLSPVLNQLVDISGELDLSDFCCLIVYNTAKPLPLMSKLCFLVLACVCEVIVKGIKAQWQTSRCCYSSSAPI